MQSGIVRPATVTALSLVLVVSLAHVTLAQIENPGNGHYYEFVNDQGILNWFEARDAAAAMNYMGVNGHLVTISSPAEQDFLLDNFGGIDLQGDSVWIGAEDFSGGEGLWRWVTGEVWGYTNWDAGTGQPDGGTTENCLVFRQNDFLWHDWLCPLDEVNFIVEYDLAPVDTAPSWMFALLALLLAGTACLALRSRRRA